MRTGELGVVGRLVGSTNNAMVVRVRPARGSHAPVAAGDADRPAAAPATPARRRPDGSVEIVLEPGDLLAVWKPTAGERPLFDFPLGTLTRREVAAFHVSEALGWGIVPPTLLRDGPLGEGMLQQWIDVDPEADVVEMVNEADPRLRRVAVFDAIVNNTDRKAGHLLPVPGGHVYAVDHGVTFSVTPKLRTVIWAWLGQPFEADELDGLTRVRDALGTAAAPARLADALGEILHGREIEVTRDRVEALLEAGRFPSPSPDWPAIPWPPY